MKRLAVLGGAGPETSAGRGPAKLTAEGWASQPPPALLFGGGAARPSEPEGSGPGASLAAPPFSPRLRVCGPARAAALEPGISKGMAVASGGSRGGTPAPPGWLGVGGGCGGRTEVEEPGQ